MSWFHGSTELVTAPHHASPAEIVACFRDQRSFLERLAFLITGDQKTAEQSVSDACEITLHGNSPFSDWLLEWAKAATISAAISLRGSEIRTWEAMYGNQRCPHVEHLGQVDDEPRAARLAFILGVDTQTLIAELDPLSRAILILRNAIRCSIQDCSLRLNVSRAAVIAANCRAMTWLDHRFCRQEEDDDVSQTL